MMTFIKSTRYILFLSLVLFVSVQSVQAQDGLLEETAKKAFGDDVVEQSLTSTIGTIIQQILSLVGVVLVVIIIYAGFLWITAGGDTEKIKRAKAWLTNSIIGLILIFGAYAISEFVIGSIINGTS